MNPTPTPLEPSEISRRTYVCDLWRGVFEGALSAGAQTFSLFIAIRYYNAHEIVKSLIAAAPFMGMLLSLLLVHYASQTRLPKAMCGAIPALITGCSLFVAAWTDRLGVFALFVIVAYICRSALLPFLTDIYGDNYPKNERGAYFSRALLLTVGVAVLTGFLGSSLLELELENFSWLFTFLGLCGLAKAYAIYSMPSRIIDEGAYAHPLGNLKYVAQDKTFGYVLLTWFIMGFANLWTLPLRVDYITSGAYGIEASPLVVALIITVIPDTMRVIFIPIWARLFDRMNFIVLRMILNLFFAIGVGSFFLTQNLVFIGMGAAFIGLAFAGGSIAWNLWVTKYAPEGKVAAYMSVHVCLTGVRGTIGPIIGYWTAHQVGPANTGLISCGMMVLATLMLIPEIRHGRRQV